MRTAPFPSCIAAFAALVRAAVGAETVYKHVDPEGNITFSADPTPSRAGETVVPIEIEPQVTEAQRQAAEQRLEEVQRAAARLEAERERDEARRAEAVEAAQQRLAKARAALQEAEQRTLDDWQYLATGGRVLKQSYLERVEAARERVQEAEEALRRARGG